MQRYIYCPSDDLLDEAIELSKNVALPVIIGDNDFSQNLTFDRSRISLLKIPEHLSIFISSTNVSQGFHQSIKYTNEFKFLKNNIKLYINNVLVPSLYEENHIVKFNYLCQEKGIQKCIIFIGEEKQEEFNFVVN